MADDVPDEPGLVERGTDAISRLKWVEDITLHSRKKPTDQEIIEIGDAAQDAYIAIRLLLQALEASPKPHS